MSSRDRAAEADRWAGLAAGVVPALYAWMSVAPFGFVAESPELAWRAIAVEGIGPAHVLGRLIALVPLGSLEMRLGLASGVALGLLAWAVARVVRDGLRRQGVIHPGVRGLTAVAAAWWVCGSGLVFGAALRPSGLTLTAALAMLGFGELQRALASDREDALPKSSAIRLGLWFGLLFAQAPGACGLIMPALIWATWRAWTRTVLGAAAGSFALSALPWFASGLGAFGAELGAPASWGHAFWPARRLLEAAPWLSAAALLGAIALIQTPPRRRPIAQALAAMIGVPLLAGGWFVREPAAADGLGVLSFVFASCVLASTALVGALWAPDGRPHASASGAQRAATGLLVVAALFQLQLTRTRDELTRFDLPEAFGALSWDELPPRALVLTGGGDSTYLARAHATTSRVRPDLDILALVELRDQARIERLAQSRPALRSFLRAHLLESSLPRAELESLTAERPVLVDPTAPIPADLAPALRPTQLYLEVLGSRVSVAERRDAAESHERTWRALTEQTTPGPIRDAWLSQRRAVQRPVRYQYARASRAVRSNHLSGP